MSSQFGLTQLGKNFEKFKREEPIKVGNTALNFFRSSFEHQGFTDDVFQPWQQVKRRIPDTPAYKYPKRRDLNRHVRGILVGKGGAKMRQAVASSLKKTTFQEILFSVSTPYAAVHNYGLRAGRGAGFQMPQRKFIGHSASLLRMIDDEIRRDIVKLKVGI